MDEANGWCAPPETMCNCGKTWRECGMACVTITEDYIDIADYVVTRSAPSPAPPVQEPPEHP